MANVKVAMSKKGMLIALVIGVLLLGGGGGYLLWRVNQQDTVAPTDSSAGTCTSDCDMCSWSCTSCQNSRYTLTDCGNGRSGCCPNGSGGGGGGVGDNNCGSEYSVTYYLKNGEKKTCSAVASQSTTACATCSYRYSCGTHCFPGNTCGKEACDNINNPPPVEKFTLTYTAGANGTISGEKTQTVSKGGSGTEVIAKPNAGYYFSNWSDGGGKQCFLPEGCEPGESTRTDTNVTKNINATAEFKPVSITTTFNLNYSAEALNGGAISGKLTPEENLKQTVTQNGNGKKITFTDDRDSYCKNKIVHWEVNGKKDSVTGDSREEKNVQENMNIVGKAAYIWTANTTTFQYFSAGHGHIQLGDGVSSDAPIKLEFKKDDYCPGVLQVRAIPQEGYKFSHWDDTIKKIRDTSPLATVNPRTDSISTSGFVANIAVTAVFVPSAECGDGICSPTENSATCSLDCPLTTVCGDGICSADETPATCPADCNGGGGSDTVPDTAIFEDTKDTIIFGIAILMIGVGWTWIVTLPKKAYNSISKASREYVTAVKQTEERNKRESRRNKLERKLK